MDTPIYYFEPNTVEYEAEDLCLGIALEVQYFDRALNGGKTLNGSVDMPLKPNILGGENNFLTTSYTDITVLELEGGGNKESIGIESIDIKYNSWYLPEVNIKFVDIRGNSVFNPMELTNNTESRDRAKGSFLKGFFMFPYPIFILTVKGYFGKPITFRLTVKGVPQAQLNAQTGNFEITVGFIGHMYYYLTDIPMSLLMIAPYINYGGVDSTLISYNNGVRVKTLPTFVDFVKDTSQAMVALAQNPVNSDTLIRKETVLSTIDQLYLLKDLMEKTENNIYEYWEILKEDVEKDILVIKILSDEILATKGVDWRVVGTELCINLRQEIFQICQRLGDKYQTMLIYSQNHIDTSIDYNNYEIKANFNKDREAITAEIEQLNNEIIKIDEEIITKTNDIYIKNYGVVPTIKNIFEITLAHLKKLHENTKACINNIANESDKRKFSKIIEETDINTNSQELTTYPFTGFLSRDKKEHLWIGTTSAQRYSETGFVNKIFDGMNTYNEQMQSAEAEYLRNKAFSVDLPPGGLFSLFTDIGIENAYYTELNKRCKGDIYQFCTTQTNGTSLPLALQVFCDRYVDALMFMKNTDYIKNVFPKIEAYKLLSCGWDERIYNENTLWGNDAEIPYRYESIEYIKSKIIEITKTLGNQPKEIVFTKNYSLSYRRYSSYTGDTSNRYKDYETDEAYLTIVKRDFPISNLSQYQIRKDWFGQSVTGGAVNLHTEYVYSKCPLSIQELDFSQLTQINSFLNFINDTTLKTIYSTSSFIGNPNEDKFNEFKDFIKTEKNPDKIISYLPYEVDDIFINSEHNKLHNKGGIICFNKYFLLAAIHYAKNHDFIVPPSSKSNSSTEVRHNSFLIFYQNIEEKTKFYERNKEQMIKSLLDVNEQGELTFKNFQQISNEQTVHFIFPFFLEKGIFSFSVGQEEEDNWVDTDKQSSETINVNALKEFYENGDSINLFINTVREYIKPQLAKQKETEETYSDVIAKIKATNEKKIAIYDIFKNLYDRWKFGAEDFRLTYNNNLDVIGIENFIFRDALNRDISESLEVNIDKFIEHIFAIYKGEKDMSLYEFLFEICSDVNCLLLALPLNSFEAIKSNNEMKQMFTPRPYSSVINNPISSTFVVTYRQKDSQHLNYHPNESAYKDDGIEFTNYISSSENGGENGLGVFGVTYGMSKQSYFKNIVSSMDKPKVTEQTIASTLSIAEQGAKNSSRNYGMSSHDVFDTYSQHSYHCSVETMGNMQIMPMMYFQLNNIPLFKGGYFITSVEHSINKDGMKTTFKGNRLSQNQIQLLRSGKYAMNVDNSHNTPNTGNSGGGSTGTNTRSYPQLTYTKENTVIVVYAGRAMTDPYHESPDLSKDREFIPYEGNTEKNEYILTPYDINGEPETRKYREYWGNRKIAMSLISKLRENGFMVDQAFWDTRKAKEKPFVSKTYTQVMGGQERNTIAVCIYSDEITNVDENGNIIAPNWGTNKQWVIYKQNKDGEYNDKTRKFEKKPYYAVSDKLAQCIANKMSTALSGETSIVVNTLPKVNETGVAWKGITDLEMPSVLSRNLYHTTRDHVKFLATKANREKIAQAHYDGIVQFFEEMKGKNSRMVMTDGVLTGKASTYFTWAELTTTLLNYANIPNEAEKQNLITLATTILDKIREAYGEPIKINSAYRCQALNNDPAIKGSKTSQHVTGSAADIDVESNNKKLWDKIVELIKARTITVGQLIWEFGTDEIPGWIHVSLPNAGKTNEVLRAKTVNNETVYEAFPI